MSRTPTKRSSRFKGNDLVFYPKEGRALPGVVCEIDRGSRPKYYRVTLEDGHRKAWFLERTLERRVELELSENEAKVPTQDLFQSRGTRGRGRVVQANNIL